MDKEDRRKLLVLGVGAAAVGEGSAEINPRSLLDCMCSRLPSSVASAMLASDSVLRGTRTSRSLPPFSFMWTQARREPGSSYTVPPVVDKQG